MVDDFIVWGRDTGDSHLIFSFCGRPQTDHASVRFKNPLPDFDPLGSGWTPLLGFVFRFCNIRCYVCEFRAPHVFLGLKLGAWLRFSLREES